MTKNVAWGTLIAGAIAAFGAAYAQSHNLVTAAEVAAVWIVGHLFPSPIASVTPPTS